MKSKPIVLQVVSCFRSLKSGGNLSVDLSIGNPMTNPPKGTKSNKDSFEVEFRDLANGNVYLCETKKHYRVGDLQKVMRAKLFDRLFASISLIEKETSKKYRVVFL